MFLISLPPQIRNVPLITRGCRPYAEPRKSLIFIVLLFCAVITVLREPICKGSQPTKCRKPGYKGMLQEAPTSQSILHKNNEPLWPSKRRTVEFGSVCRK